MKSFVSAVVLFSAAGIVSAQQGSGKVVETTAASPEAKARIVAELAAAQSRGSVKGVPMSAEEVNESTQTLADGNRIVRSSTGKFYRNSDGRVRREMQGGTGGMLGTTFSFGQGVSILSPDSNSKYLLDSQLKTAKVIELAQQPMAIAPGRVTEGRLLTEARAMTPEERAKYESRAQAFAGSASVAAAAQPGTVTIAGPGGFSFSSGGQNTNYDVRTEELGTRDFEGVQAEGTRRTTTIPAGAIGNERPIEIVYERWFSKELGLVVYSKNSDPRFGEQTYKMTNIVRSEPDPSLFSIPTHYKTLTTEPGMIYKIEAPAAPKTSRLPAPPKPVNVSMPAKAARP